MVQQHGLGQLRLGDRRSHLQQRLGGEHGGALGYRPYIAGEPQPPELLQRRLAVVLGAPQVGKIVTGEGEGLEEGQAVLQAGRDQEAAALGQTSGEQAEHRLARHPPAQVTGGHIQLVQIGQQSTRHGRPPLPTTRAVASSPSRGIAARVAAWGSAAYFPSYAWRG